MKTIKSVLVAMAFMCTPMLAFAQAGMMHEDMGASQMKSMDTNGDGLISKDEFMKAHEAKWDAMQKNKDGMVSIADMEKMHRDKMMKHREMRMKQDDTKKKEPTK